GRARRPAVVHAGPCRRRRAAVRRAGLPGDDLCGGAAVAGAAEDAHLASRGPARPGGAHAADRRAADAGGAPGPGPARGRRRLRRLSPRRPGPRLRTPPVPPRPSVRSGWTTAAPAIARRLSAPGRGWR